MAVNIFDDLVRAALNAQGYLTYENASYHPSIHGEPVPGQSGRIALIGLHPRKMGPDRILAVTCWSEREPFDIEGLHGQDFAELHDAAWAKAFRNCIGDVVGAKSAFTHVTAARTIIGDRDLWTANESFRRMLKNPLALWDANDILGFIGRRTAQTDAENSGRDLIARLNRAA